MSSTAWRDDFAEWTEAEREWFLMGPFDGGIPGLVRRVRRILDVSQRGLAALLDVSQSVVARWETGRTSPRANVLHYLLGMAGLRASVHDEETGAEVEPMRDDGARRHGGNRFPAHTDLRVVGWWIPSHVESTMVEYGEWRNRSRARRDPMIRSTLCPHLDGSSASCTAPRTTIPRCTSWCAEAEHLDDRREQRRLSARPPAGAGRCVVIAGLRCSRGR